MTSTGYVRIPDSMLKSSGIKPGDTVSIRAQCNVVLISKSTSNAADGTSAKVGLTKRVLLKGSPFTAGTVLDFDISGHTIIIKSDADAPAPGPALYSPAPARWNGHHKEEPVKELSHWELLELYAR